MTQSNKQWTAALIAVAIAAFIGGALWPHHHQAPLPRPGVAMPSPATTDAPPPPSPPNH